MHYSNRRGYETEMRFFRVCEAALADGRLPRWISAIRRGTRGEDRDGIDAIATTTNGTNIPLQLKSSKTAKDYFRRDPSHRHIKCIVLTPELSDEMVLEKVSRALIAAGT